MDSIVDMVHSLPTGVVGHVLTYVPRHNAAQLIVDAHKNNSLSLVYLRRYKVDEGAYKDDLFGTLAPSVLGRTAYGDENSPMKIHRSRISFGENLKLRLNATEVDDDFIEFE